MEKFIKFLFGLMTPIIKFVNKCVNVPFIKKEVTGDHYYSWRDKINKGQTLLTSTNGSGSNLLNISDLNHGAIYYGRGLKWEMTNLINRTADQELKDRLIRVMKKYKVRDDICYVLESVYDGVIPTNLVKFMTTKDVFVCTELKTMSKMQKSNAADLAIRDLGLGYDYKFSENDKHRYCFEVVARAYELSVPTVQIKRTIFKIFGIRLYSSFLSDSFTGPEWKTVIDSRKDVI